MKAACIDHYPDAESDCLHCPRAKPWACCQDGHESSPGSGFQPGEAWIAFEKEDAEWFAVLYGFHASTCGPFLRSLATRSADGAGAQQQDDGPLRCGP